MAAEEKVCLADLLMHWHPLPPLLTLLTLIIIYLLSASESSLSLPPSPLSEPVLPNFPVFQEKLLWFMFCLRIRSGRLTVSGVRSENIPVKQTQTRQDSGAGQILCDVWRALITSTQLWRGYDWSWMFDKLLFTPTLCEGKSMRNWRFGETR